jgi:hypothetical protein
VKNLGANEKANSLFPVENVVSNAVRREQRYAHLTTATSLLIILRLVTLSEINRVA